MSEKTRTEHDTLGEVQVPAGAYWGAQTQRALENFPVSGLKAHPALIRACVAVKLAAARTNQELGKLDALSAEMIENACREVLDDGKLIDQWVVDVFQAGAGTSFNMNTNEVLANRANQILEAPLGSYSLIHPNDHVNMSQSTNDTFPTAMQVAAIAEGGALAKVLDTLADALRSLPPTPSPSAAPQRTSATRWTRARNFPWAGRPPARASTRIPTTRRRPSSTSQRSPAWT